MLTTQLSMPGDKLDQLVLTHKTSGSLTVDLGNSFRRTFELDYFQQQLANIEDCMIRSEAYENSIEDKNWKLRLWKCKEYITLQMICDYNGDVESKFMTVYIKDFLKALKILCTLN